MNLHDFVHTPAVTCSPGAGLAAVAAMMDSYNIGSVVVTDDSAGGAVLGIVTDRDLAVRGLGRSLGPDTEVREVMSPNVAVIAEDADLLEAAHQMAESGCRRLPVIGADGLLKGIVALDDLMILFAQQADDLAHAVASETTTPLPPAPK